MSFKDKFNIIIYILFLKLTLMCDMDLLYFLLYFAFSKKS